MKKWALVSVFDKRGIADFCRAIVEAGYGILSTGGTSRHLKERGIAVTEVEDYTGFPEMMDGRVKTLHPRIHGGLLGLRDNPEHVASMTAHGIDSIELVVVNLYPFQDTIAKPGTTFEEAVEMIDIGGPSMLRAAAKNFRFCAPVVDPSDYTWVAEALKSNGLSAEQRLRLAAKVFAVTSVYDTAIDGYLSAAVANAGQAEDNASQPVDCVQALDVRYELKQSLRYGENPHQGAAFYREVNASFSSLGGATQLAGKELSYNNIQDADAALQILRNLDNLGRPAVVAVKHMNPCGVGLGETIQEAYRHAYEADPVSIFGGIIACNRPINSQLAEQLTELFLEIVIAPSFDDEALTVFQKKKNVRLLTVAMDKPLWTPGAKLLKRVSGGLLVQDVDLATSADWTVVTQRAPSDEERRALEFAWRIVKFVKSNAIVVATENRTLGVGAGQMNRVGAAQIALKQAGAQANGAVLSSDAFFPMRDTVDTAAAAGIKAIIQPGGSIKDAESITAADEHGIAMVFTGQRHFLH